MLGLILALYLFISLPFFQKWMAGKAAGVLAELLDTKVEIGRIEITPLGRLIIDDFKIWDRQGKPMLNVSRMGVQMNYKAYFEHKYIVINSAQLFGADAMLYQERIDSAANYQFLIDALKSKDTTQHKPMPHIEVRSFVMRHTDLWYDRNWVSHKENEFDINHLEVNDLSFKADMNILMDDTLNLYIGKLSLKEKSGFKVNNLTFELENGKASGIQLTDFTFDTDGSHFASPSIIYKDNTINGELEAKVCPADFAPFYSPLKQIDDLLYLNLKAFCDKKNISLSDLDLHDEKGTIKLSASGMMIGGKDNVEHLDININNLSLTNDFQNLINPIVKNQKATDVALRERIFPLISKLGKTEVKGKLNWSRGAFTADANLNSALGNILADGTLQNGHLKAHAKAERFQAGTLLSAIKDSLSSIGTITALVDVDGTLKGSNGKPEGSLKADITEAQFRNYTYHNINADIKRNGTMMTAKVKASDPAVNMNVDMRMNLGGKAPYVQGIADIRNLDLQSTHLISNKHLHKISTKIGVDLEGNIVDNMAGTISIPHIIITDFDGNYTLEQMQLESNPDGRVRHVKFTSPYLTLKADGQFELASLGSYFQEMAHNWLPNVFNAPRRKSLTTVASIEGKLVDPSPFDRFSNTNIKLKKGPLLVKAHMNSEERTFNAEANSKSIILGNTELLDFDLNAKNTPDQMNTTVSLQKSFKNKMITVSMNIATEGNKLNTSIKWDDHKAGATDGEVVLKGTMEKNAENGLAVYADVLPTQLHINDTLWNIHPAQLYFRNKELYVDNFKLSMHGGLQERSLTIHGTASKDDDDSIYVNLKNIDLSYIFTLAKVKPVHLAGFATGTIVGRRIFKSPVASGRVDVPNFIFNGANMGNCDCYLAWGDPHGDLILKGVITDFKESSRINVNGYLHLLKDPIQSIDLNIDFQRANAAFMQRYVNNIMENVQGRASGRLHIFGPFKEVDLDGDVFAHRFDMTIPSLNVRYHAIDESIIMRPGYIQIDSIKGYDRDGVPGQAEHSALVNGRITYEHFKNMKFNFDIQGNNILAYDTKRFDDMPFYATCYGSGNVKLDGGPGYVNIDIDATPLKGTTLTYNASSPETLTKAGFITFVDRSKKLEEELKGRIVEEEKKPASDMHINFNLNLTPDAQLRLLMDPKTDDYISLYGHSHLRATYYNKGRFQMYGTYRVDHGTYKMTLQDVIHKDFQFRKNGTIVFGGNPFDADLGLQAVYTVPGVSLNDLSARGTFSNSTVRVNCIMNLGGKAGAPRVTFDFDIPNVNEEEARMVRSLISTEEERNLQVIYLLGIGRFYTYNYTGSQTQSSTAMNSLLSSTLSGQLNQMLNNMMGGNSNWNFGANLSTGNTGWSDMDVEGMLSGRLLNNRLLINGNFGYRDNPVAQSNFIGDFDLQYLLTKNGNLILKAYSETNDRYFTKSSLTTQGIGLMVKKDFTNLADLFNFLKKKINKTKQEHKKNKK